MEYNTSKMKAKISGWLCAVCINLCNPYNNSVTHFFFHFTIKENNVPSARMCLRS